jgi:LacI family kdg operon repressor
VSRYLGGNLHALSEDILGRIRAAVVDLDYHPSQIARSLKGGKTRLIGMIVADVANPYSVAVLKGAEDECQRQGYTLALCDSGGDGEGECKLVAGLCAYSIEGLILNTVGSHARQFSDIPSSLPVVLLDRRLPGADFDFIGLDNVAAAEAATRHLIERGFRDLVLVAEPRRGVSVRRERIAGFRQTVSRNPGCTGEVAEVDLRDADAVVKALSAFMAVDRRQPKAVIAASGLVTLRVVEAAQALGLNIPADLGLVGFDELDWSALVGTGITIVAQPTFEIGVTAVRYLLSRLAGDRSSPRRTLFPGRLIIRGSSQAPRRDGATA